MVGVCTNFSRELFRGQHREINAKLVLHYLSLAGQCAIVRWSVGADQAPWSLEVALNLLALNQVFRITESVNSTTRNFQCVRPAKPPHEDTQTRSQFVAKITNIA